MDFEEKDFVSKEKHELDYLLGKWGKRASDENRDMLIEALDRFRAEAGFSPHKREQFYAFVEEVGLLERLEDREEGEEAEPGTEVEGEGEGKAKGEARWWFVFPVLVVLVLGALLVRSCGAFSRSPPPVSPPLPPSSSSAPAFEAPSPGAAPTPKTP
jgi:hypothetical protein